MLSDLGISGMTSSPDLRDVLILWDIDGTLIEHAPGRRDRHAHAVEQVLGVTLEPIPPGLGKTDRQIVLELFAQHTDPTPSQLDDAFTFLDAVTQTDLDIAPARALDGITEALLQTARAGVRHTVLTGNTPQRARIKLSSAGLNAHIDLDSGFFGDAHPTRMELVADAAQHLSQHSSALPVIIGDTPLDILAAQASGIPVIAVATGVCSVAELTEHQPDCVIPHFTDPAWELADVISDVIAKRS
jgi:phosphoglycolate phosphatase-like HAD superfamily hydrolase